MVTLKVNLSFVFNVFFTFFIGGCMFKFFAWVTTLSLVLVIVVCTVRWYGFNKGCESYLKLAGDAPSVEKAEKFLGKALDYLTENDLIKGNSAFLFPTPTTDVGIWYEQIKGAHDNMVQVIARESSGSISQIEKDNALMKVREVVLDNSSSGTEVTCPANISWFPNQWPILIWWIATVLLGIAAGIAFYRERRY